MRAGLIGFGAVGFEVARQLLAGDGSTERGIDSLTVVHRDPPSVAGRVELLGNHCEVRQGSSSTIPDVDVMVIASAKGSPRIARAALRSGAHTVCCTDDPSEVRALLALDGLARSRRRTLVVGASMAPGLTCLLARQAAVGMSRVDEVHVASLGTGGPACARSHHSSLTAVTMDWDDGEWRRRPGGSGRELLWFPDPVGGADCYRAGLPDAMLLVPAFPGVRRVTARRHATRRDRFTSWLPMLRSPHPEGLTGAARAEVRGWSGRAAQTATWGAVGRPAAAAGAVCAVAAVAAGRGALRRTGAGGLATLVDEPGPYLAQLSRRGVVVSVFEGSEVPHEG